MFQIPVDQDRIADLCRRWHITELSLFGSILREDFRPDSDVDVRVVFAPDTEPGWEDGEKMEEELEAIFGRPVDRVEKEAVRNPFRRRDLLKTHRIVHAA